jgi:hypothetical protein
MSPYWMMCALPVGWQYVLQSYRENVQYVRNKVDTARAVATVAANTAREYAKEAAEYEKQTMEVVVVRRRDAMLAESIKITDFFDRATESRGAFAGITDAAKAATVATRAAKEAAKEADAAVKEAEKRTGAGADSGRKAADESLKKATAAYTAAQDAEKKAEFAQARVSECQNAQKQTTDARQKALDNSNDAVKAAKLLKDLMANSSATLFTAVDGAENVRRLADQAMAEAVEGDKKAASSLVAEASGVVEKVEKAKEELLSAKKDARETFFNLIRHERFSAPR